MGRIQSRPDTFFRVGPVKPGGLQCFTVGHGDVAKSRCDVDFHHPSYASLVRQIETLPNTALISEIIASPLISGFAAGKENRAQSGEESAPQIRPTQILPDGEIDTSGAYGIGVKNVSERDYLQNGEVLFNNTNSTSLVGKSAVFREDVAAVCSNHVTRLLLKDGIEPEFVEMVLNMLQQQGYFARLCTNFNNQAGVNTTALANVRIPFPSAEQRESLVADMLAAREERRAKLAEADALLAGIDDFMLQALGIAPPAEDTRRVFAVSLAQMSGQERINSDYYHPERVQALRGLEQAADSMTVAPLIDVVDFMREQLKTPGANYLSLAHVQGHIGELTDAADTASGNCFAYKTDDVLFARLRPYLNKVYCAEMDGCCSTEFHVLRVKDNGTLLPEYLAAVLRSRLALAQTTHMMTGNTHPRLTNDDVTNRQFRYRRCLFKKTSPPKSGNDGMQRGCCAPRRKRVGRQRSGGLRSSC